jgi:hypothetical protein
MSSSSSVTITGLKELQMMMSQFPQQFGKIFQNAGTTYAKKVYGEAYKRVPVKTGFLRGSIGQQVNTKEIKIYANAKYAAAVHNGSRGRPGRPFLFAPAKENTPQFFKDLDMQTATYFKSRAK